jgi:Fe-S cluster assembly iron-binding protein IscA
MEKCSSAEGGYLMFTVTDKASEVIKDFLKDKNESSAVRIIISQG